MRQRAACRVHHHAAERRDADATRQKDRGTIRVVVQRQVAVGAFHLDEGADARRVEIALEARVGPPDRDFQLAVARVAGDREGPDPAAGVGLFKVGKRHVHRLPGHELEALGSAQAQRQRAFGDFFPAQQAGRGGGRGPKEALAPPLGQRHAVAHAQGQQGDVDRARDQLHGLHGVEDRIELAGPGLVRQEQRRGNQHENAVGGNEGHALELGADRAFALPLGQEDAGAAGGRQRRDQHDETPGDGRLDRRHHRMGGEQFGNGGREPEGRNREDRDQAGERVNDSWHHDLLFVWRRCLPRRTCTAGKARRQWITNRPG